MSSRGVAESLSNLVETYLFLLLHCAVASQHSAIINLGRLASLDSNGLCARPQENERRAANIERTTGTGLDYGLKCASSTEGKASSLRNESLELVRRLHKREVASLRPGSGLPFQKVNL